jgi:hypothetical protein
MVMLLWKGKRKDEKVAGGMQGDAPATGVVKRGKAKNPEDPEGKETPEEKTKSCGRQPCEQ